MAIDIIPKPGAIAKREVSYSQVLSYVLIILLLFAFLGYFSLNVMVKKSQQKLEEVKSAVSKTETKEVQELEDKIIRAKEKIGLFSKLLDSRKKSSNFFNFLKENCHSKASFSELKLDLERGEVVISGQAESFRVLGEQMLIFKNSELIQSVNLSTVSIEREGGIGFELNLSLDPRIFK